MGSLARQNQLGSWLREGFAAGLDHRDQLPGEDAELEIHKPGAVPSESRSGLIFPIPFGNRSGSQRFMSPAGSTQKWMLHRSNLQPAAFWLSA